MKRILQSGWVAAVMGAVAYALTTWLVWQGGAASPGTPAHAPGKSTLGPSWSFHNPELDQLMEELQKNRESLAAREQKLNELEQRLQVERKEIQTVLQSAQQLRKEFDADLVRVRDEESANLKKLGKVYAAMEPTAAALVLKELTDEQVVKIMVFMKETETAPILEKIAKQGQSDAKRVALISERLRLAVFRDTRGKPKSS